MPLADQWEAYEGVLAGEREAWERNGFTPAKAEKLSTKYANSSPEALAKMRDEPTFCSAPPPVVSPVLLYAFFMLIWIMVGGLAFEYFSPLVALLTLLGTIALSVLLLFKLNPYG